MDTIQLQTQTLDAQGGRNDDLGSLGRETTRGDSVHILALQIGERVGVSANKDEIVNVNQVARTVQKKVGRSRDAVLRLQKSESGEKVLVAGLGDENGVRPAHGKSGAAWVELPGLAGQAKLRGPNRGKAEKPLHPIRKQNAVVEVVEVHLGGKDWRP